MANYFRGTVKETSSKQYFAFTHIFISGIFISPCHFCQGVVKLYIHPCLDDQLLKLYLQMTEEKDSETLTWMGLTEKSHYDFTNWFAQP